MTEDSKQNGRIHKEKSNFALLPYRALPEPKIPTFWLGHSDATMIAMFDFLPT